MRLDSRPIRGTSAFDGTLRTCTIESRTGGQPSIPAGENRSRQAWWIRTSGKAGRSHIAWDSASRLFAAGSFSMRLHPIKKYVVINVLYITLLYTTSARKVNP